MVARRTNAPPLQSKLLLQFAGQQKMLKHFTTAWWVIMALTTFLVP